MSQQAPQMSHKDAKAQAKAAKAYAKAQRPWWKRKRWIFGILILLVVVAAAASGGGNSNDSKDAAKSGGTSSSEAAEPRKFGSVGEALTNAGTTYKVTSAETTQTIGNTALGGAQADGTFIVVNLELTNKKDETKTFLESSAKIVTADGKSYETSDKTVLAFGDKSLLLRDIQPDLTAKGKLAFDVPPSKADDAKLVITDLFGDGEITVDLGL